MEQPPAVEAFADAPRTLPPTELAAQTVYQGVLVSVVALYLYSKGVALFGPTVGASFAALVPVLAILVGPRREPAPS